MSNPEDAIAYFIEQLKIYQNTAYAMRFKTIINKFLTQIDHHKIDRNTIGVKATRALYRAMAIKDEYEVARLLTEQHSPQNWSQLAEIRQRFIITSLLLFSLGLRITMGRHVKSALASG